MSYQIGTTVEQQFVDETAQTTESLLPTLIVGPLFQVFTQEIGVAFDPTSASDQTFAWPSKPVGSAIDLQGTRAGTLDAQRMPLAPMQMKFYLYDGTEHIELEASSISDVNQAGFTIKSGAQAGKGRATVSDARIMTVDGETFVYSPGGNLSAVKSGDLFLSSTKFTTDVVEATKVTTEEDLSGQAVALTAFETDEAGSLSVDIAKGATSGRITIDISGGTFGATVANAAIVVGQKQLGLTGVAGAMVGGDSTDIDGLSFGVTTSLAEVDGYVVKVVVDPGGSPQSYWSKVAAIDTAAGTLSIADALTGVADDAVVSVTIYKSQVGYVESIATGAATLTAVVPTTFADSDTFAYVSNTASAITFYPPFSVSADYRAIRKDKSGSILSASSISDLQSVLGVTTFDHRDSIGFAAQTYLNARVSNDIVYLAVVDPEPDGLTGLPENRDLATAYGLALEDAESVDVYNIIALDDGQDDLVVAHVLAMSEPEEKLERRAFIMKDVDLWASNSTSGIVQPGRTVDGLAPTGDEGNSTIRDASLEFVTGEGILAGQKLVVTSPASLAGTYTVDVGVTDSEISLVEGIWDLDKETVAGSGSVTTTGGFHDISGLDANALINAEADDYLELTLGGTAYRMRIESVLADGTGCKLSDEVAGDLSFTAEAATAVSLIRSWSPTAQPALEYYVAPLTREQVKDALVAGSPYSNRRVSVVLSNRVFMTTGTDSSGEAIQEYINPRLQLCAIAAKRSGNHPSDDVSNLTLGGGISKVERAFNFFRRTQLNALAQAGYLLIEQVEEGSSPFIRDMLTSNGASLERHEEVVTANADWQSKQLRSLFGNAPGRKIYKNVNARVGIRYAQLYAILSDWRGRGFLLDFKDVVVQRSASNGRKTDVSYTSIVPLGDKETEIKINLTTDEA